MRYTFIYQRIELGRMRIQCVDIPQLHTEQLPRDTSPVSIMRDVYEALNLFLSISILINEAVPSPKCKFEGEGYFSVDVSPANKIKLLNKQP